MTGQDSWPTALGAGRKWPPTAVGAALIVGSAIAFALDGPVARAAYQQGLDPAAFGFWRASAGMMVLGGCAVDGRDLGGRDTPAESCRDASVPEVVDALGQRDAFSPGAGAARPCLGAVDTGEDATAGTCPAGFQVCAEQTGQRRGDGDSAPFPRGET